MRQLPAPADITEIHDGGFDQLTAYEKGSTTCHGVAATASCSPGLALNDAFYLESALAAASTFTFADRSLAWDIRFCVGHFASRTFGDAPLATPEDLESKRI